MKDQTLYEANIKNSNRTFPEVRLARHLDGYRFYRFYIGDYNSTWHEAGYKDTILALLKEFNKHISEMIAIMENEIDHGIRGCVICDDHLPQKVLKKIGRDSFICSECERKNPQLF